MSKDNNLNTLLCFLSDDTSIEVMQATSLNNLGLSLEVKKGGIEECLKYLKANQSPDVLVVDISDSKLPMTDMMKLAEVCEPGVEVITVGNRNEVGLFRDLIHLGIKDYLVKPLTSAHIFKALEHILVGDKKVAQPGKFNKSGKLVTFVGSHGGVGVSTLVANSAWVLAEKESKRVSIIDLDIQLGIIPHFFNLEPSVGLQELFETPERIDETLINRSMTHVGQNLTILSSQTSLQDQPDIGLKAIESITQELLSNVHFILADLPRNFSTPSNTFLLQRSNIVVVTTDYSLIGLKETSRFLELCKDRLVPDQEIIIIANKLNQYKAGELTREMFEEALQHKVTLEIAFDPLNPLEALRDGIPLANKMKGSVYKGVLAIVNRLLGKEMNHKEFKGILGYLKNLKF
ncbi:MAG: AAA family ATPase [Candidatus Paracaedimonas acanthamoebae]|uniref:AAA family ATPase n=1 Tax=Candidatus Paracaedimonas acanthamoebae TaxID=244581 RepID=A0A8J7PSF6_9PROT|nr:AAA family ATPase [Candidatus Paracaedimonas acanthamoebae]